MYDFTGCECAICHQHFKIDSDIVVCPDCGTPYHRDCYQTLGHCKHRDAHSKDFSWQPPKQYETPTLIHCARCGAQNNKEDEYCNHCGLALSDSVQNPQPKVTPQGDAAAQRERSSVQNIFTIAKENEQAYLNTFQKTEVFCDVPLADWLMYLGKRKVAYLTNFKLMKLRKRKYSFSFSAMLFGPLYFFYRKAWGWALLFTFVSLVLNIPSFLTVLIYSESVYAPNVSEDFLYTLSQISVALSWAVMMLRGLYGNYLYQISAAKTIKKIKARASTEKEKWLMLQLYGGTSWPAVILVLTVAVVLANGFSSLMGPEFDAMLEMLYY